MTILAKSVISGDRQAHAAPTPSALWGADGAKWTPASRLPDFSFAGYRSGERPIPSVPVVADVKQFGAVGDGRTDDTAAFSKALASCAEGAVLVPAGRYVLTDMLVFDRSGVVLRGAGIGRTMLVFPKSLAQVRGKGESTNDKFSWWSCAGGFLEVQGKDAGLKLSDVAEPAKRGDCRLVLKDAVGLAPGSRVRLLMNNDPGLGRHLHADLQEGGEWTGKELTNLCDWVATVAAVNGRAITLNRPLRLDVRPEWKAEIWSYEPTVEEVGIESLTFEFAGAPKLGHLQEEGFNAVFMVGAANCWVRDVEIVDADNGIDIDAMCRFCQVEGIRLRTAKRDSELSGHHALWATGKSQDCLITGFRFETTYHHDLTVEGGANGTVFERGSGIAIDLDHHANAPYENLFTEIDVGDPRRLWHSGGGGPRGPHSAARTTLWNLFYPEGQKFRLPREGEKLDYWTLYYREAFRPPAVPDWPQINVIGLKDCPERPAGESQAWIEPCSGGVTPGNLYRAQLAHRLGARSRK